MAKFKVIAQISYLLECEVEAENWSEARELAYQLDGGDFKEIDGSSLWEIEDVQLVEDDSIINAVKSINKDIREGLV